MKRRVLFLLLSIFLAFSASQSFAAKIYKYIDDNGSVVFVDNEAKIPAKYRQETTKLKEVTDGMTPEERKDYERRKQQQDAQEAIDERLEQRNKKQKAAQQAQETAVQIGNNQVIVPVKVRHGRNSAKLNMLLDTGANTTVIYYPALERFRFKRSELGMARVAGGHVVPTVRVKFYKFSVGPHEVKYMPITIMDQVSRSRIDGLLGMDFLRQHKYEIDFERKVIVWKD